MMSSKGAVNAFCMGAEWSQAPPETGMVWIENPVQWQFCSADALWCALPSDEGVTHIWNIPICTPVL